MDGGFVVVRRHHQYIVEQQFRDVLQQKRMIAKNSQLIHRPTS
jgi:hypothetical protein